MRIRAWYNSLRALYHEITIKIYLGWAEIYRRVVVSQNLDDVKLRKFYDRIFKADLEISEFFEEILEGNVLQGKPFTAKVVAAKGKPYTDKDGNQKEGSMTYNLDLSSVVEMEALDKINEKK